MLAEATALLRRLIMAADLAVVVGSFLVAYLIRDRILGPAFGELRPLSEHLGLLLVLLPIWLVCLRSVGLYRSLRSRRLGDVLWDVAKAQALATLLLLSFLFVARRWEVSRLLTQIFLGVSLLSLAVQKVLIVQTLRRLRASGRNARYAVVAGPADRAMRYIEFLQDHPYWGIRVLGMVDPGTTSFDEDPSGYPVIGKIKDLAEILQRCPADEVAFTVTPREFPAIEEYLDLCQEMGVTSRIILDVPRRAWTRQQLEWVDGLGVLSLNPVAPSPLQLALKRVMDIAGGLAGLVFLALAYLWYARRILGESLGPVLFAQTRVGRNGRRFTLYKFRTMYMDAEARRGELLKANEMRGAVFKIRDDPRITAVGKRLRACHLDELPQFWNVLRGEMSLVGTRPPTEDEVACYQPHHRRRLSMKPGITGLWQLQGNGKILDFEEIVGLDCKYIDSWSIWLDLQILAKTLVKVARATGW